MDGQHLLPKLECLRIFEGWGGDVVNDSIASMVESWWWTDDAPHKVLYLKRVDLIYFTEIYDSRLREKLECCSREV